MINFLIGVLFGFILSTLLLFFIKKKKSKKGLKYEQYKKLPFLIKINDTLRHIVYEYGIKNLNEDFLLNIFFKEQMIVQVMHRAHFPFLIGKENESNFGMALYIPISKLSKVQKDHLVRILEEETLSSTTEIQPIQYHVVDLGKGIKLGGYLISRILKEVFEYDLNECLFKLQLYREGPLPYFPEKQGFTLPNG